jgi:glycosyltransferase involved in cell wall biosynthesis
MSHCDPGVSVIIPAYNAAPFIAETLDSVFAQTTLPQEVVVVNDGSPDTPVLEQVLEPYRQSIVYVKQTNKGVSAARNTAIRAATQPLIACLDSDDLWKPRYLEVQTGFLRDHPEIDIVYPNGIIFGTGPGVGKRIMDVSPSNGDVTFEKLVRLQCNVNTSITGRREALIRAGLYDESLKTSEDFDLWLRVYKTGGRIAYHREVLMMHRLRSGSLSAHELQMFTDFFRVLQKAEDTLDLTASEKDAIRVQRREYQAARDLHAGKVAFASGNTAAAIELLSNANRVYDSSKISAALFFMRVAPRLFLKLYQLRDAVVLRGTTRVPHQTS